MSEEFLTPEDFKITKLPVPDSDILNKMNHPDVDEDTQRTDLEDLIDEEKPIGLTTSGKPIYSPDDPADLYRSKINEKENLKGIILGKGIYVKSNTPNHYKAGFTISESTVTRRKNDDGKWPTKQGLKLYEAISNVFFSFVSERNGENIEMRFNPGDLFWAPKTGEKNNHK